MQLHEAAGQGLIEGIALVVGSQIEVVEGLRAAATVDVDSTSVHNHADIAGDGLLGGIDERIQAALQRSEPS